MLQRMLHALECTVMNNPRNRLPTNTVLNKLIYAPAGNSWDLSSAVMDRALMHADGVYKFPAQRVRGHMCRTNIASNTAFRGFGGPQVRAEIDVAGYCKEATGFSVVQLGLIWGLKAL